MVKGNGDFGLCSTEVIVICEFVEPVHLKHLWSLIRGAPSRYGKYSIKFPLGGDTIIPHSRFGGGTLVGRHL